MVRRRGAAVVAEAAPRLEFRLSGSGGQGLLVAAVLLSDAAATAGKEVVQTQSYGPEARGGASRAEVIVSDWEIDFPEVGQADVTLCLSQAACDTFGGQTKPGGLIVYESDLVQPPDLAGVRLVGLPFTAIAKQIAGTPMAANVVALGALAQLTRAVSREALEESLRQRLPKRHVEPNLRAMDAGWEAAAPPSAD